jgi:hypothetical protein
VLDIHDNTMRACASVYLGGGMTDRSRSENADHRKTAHNLRTGVPTMKETKPIMETPPLTRAGRKLAEAKFEPTVDGKRVVREYIAHGIKVTEWVDVEKIAGAGKDKK